MNTTTKTTLTSPFVRAIRERVLPQMPQDRLSKNTTAAGNSYKLVGSTVHELTTIRKKFGLMPCVPFGFGMIQPDGSLQSGFVFKFGYANGGVHQSDPCHVVLPTDDIPGLLVTTLSTTLRPCEVLLHVPTDDEATHVIRYLPWSALRIPSDARRPPSPASAILASADAAALSAFAGVRMLCGRDDTVVASADVAHTFHIAANIIALLIATRTAHAHARTAKQSSTILAQAQQDIGETYVRCLPISGPKKSPHKTTDALVAAFHVWRGGTTKKMTARDPADWREWLRLAKEILSRDHDRALGRITKSELRLQLRDLEKLEQLGCDQHDADLVIDAPWFGVMAKINPVFVRLRVSMHQRFRSDRGGYVPMAWLRPSRE